MPTAPLSFELIRPDDLLNLRIVASNLVLQTDPAGDVWLVPDGGATPARLTIHFPPQHICEEAVFTAAPPPGLEADNAPHRDPARDDDSTDPDPPTVPGTYRARMARPSRLVFDVPAGTRIACTVEGLLDWRTLTPRLHPIAKIGRHPTAEQRRDAPRPSEPDASCTALELPFRLLISPNDEAVWVSQPLRRRHGRAELWHARLALREGDGIADLDKDRTAPLRALWATDPPAERNQMQETPGIGLTALSPNDRHQLVILTSAFHGYQEGPSTSPPSGIANTIGLSLQQSGRPRFPRTYVPKPFDASQLMLSSLGGWLKSRGYWNPPRRVTTTGPVAFEKVVRSPALEHFLTPVRRRERDEAVRVTGVRESHASDVLDLLGIPPDLAIPPARDDTAPQLDLSEWVHVATQGRDHYVRVVYEGELWPFCHRAAMVKITERKFRQDAGTGVVVARLEQRVFIVVREPVKAIPGRDTPFTEVELTTRVTPDLEKPTLEGRPELSRTFWVNVLDAAGQAAPFQFHAVGKDRAGRRVDFTTPLLFSSLSDTQTRRPKVAKLYNDATAPPQTERRAELSGHAVAYARLDNDNPLLATDSLLYWAHASGVPTLRDAFVRVPALVELLGENRAVRIHYDTDYVDHDFQPGQTNVFAVLDAPLPLQFRADRAGGIATPNQDIIGLSLAQGPVAGAIADAKAGVFDPAKYFPPTLPSLPKLFGTFGLDTLLAGGALDGQAPKIVREPGGQKTTLVWEPDLKTDAITVGVATFKALPPDPVTKPKLHIEASVSVPPAGVPSSSFSGRMGKFDVTLLKSVALHFRQLSFSSTDGQQPKVEVELESTKPLEFMGDLRFVEELRKVIPPDLFGKGANLEITGAAIRAGFAIGLPPLEIGVFALKDVNLGAAITLPFLDGKPLLDFNVSERANPFQLRVAFFAGGGFFRLQLDTGGMRQLEAALEFGAAFGLNLGVASGEVHAMAGIYFAIQTVDTQSLCQLTGYLRVGGSLSVLGLIRVSIEFNLSFTYQEATDKAYGRATLTVMVEVLMFSKSVELTVERAFGGSNDPLFLQTFDTADRWQTYAKAFATA